MKKLTIPAGRTSSWRCKHKVLDMDDEADVIFPSTDRLADNDGL